MNRRNFIDNLLIAGATFAILPGAGRLWKAMRRPVTRLSLLCFAPLRFKLESGVIAESDCDENSFGRWEMPMGAIAVCPKTGGRWRLLRKAITGEPYKYREGFVDNTHAEFYWGQPV